MRARSATIQRCRRFISAPARPSSARRSACRDAGHAPGSREPLRLVRLGNHMSGGEQQMLTVARTLMGNPLLVLLDEPSEGVAPVIVEQMANTILELKKEGLSIVLSEQNIHFAELVSDRVYVLEKGQIRWQGSMAELMANSEVQRAFLTV